VPWLPNQLNEVKLRLAYGKAGNQPTQGRFTFLTSLLYEGLAGTRLQPADVEVAAARCLEEAEPASDVRASAAYRRHLIPILVERALGDLARQRR